MLINLFIFYSLYIYLRVFLGLFIITMNRTVLKSLSYLGAAIHEGQSSNGGQGLKGVANGPDVIRQSGVFNALTKTYQVEKIRDYGNISINSISTNQILSPIQHPVNNIHLLNPLLRALNNKLTTIYNQRDQNNIVLTVGGDHSVGSATIHASLKANPNLKVIWVDAHPDFVQPYLKGGSNLNYHGMPLSHICGLFKLPGFDWMNLKLPFQNIVLIGIRDIQRNQYDSIRRHKIKSFTIQHINKYGIGEVMSQAIKYLDPQGNSPFHISFDLDSLDPYIVSQTGTVFRNGLTNREACHIIKRVVNERMLVSMDIVELNMDLGQHKIRPTLRNQQELNPNLSQSVGVAVDLITSLCDLQLTL